MPSDCIFCKIIAKKIPANIIYEDDSAIAFLDIKPINPGHVLVVPKTHTENIFDIQENILENTMKVVKKIARALDKISNGVNIGQNNRRAAGQLVDHVHFHVIPRYEHDGLQHWPGKNFTKDQAEHLTKELKKIIHEVETENP